MNARQQRLQIVRTERRDATLAAKEGRGNLRNAQLNRSKGNTILANQQYQEARWDFFWAARRRAIATHQLQLANAGRRFRHTFRHPMRRH